MAKVSDNLLLIDDELRAICCEIIEQRWSATEWAARESDDWFKSANYSGGFDATEEEFCFAVIDDGGTEWWFQFPLAAAADVLSHKTTSFECRLAE